MPPTIHADPVPLQADREGTLRVPGTRVTLETIVAHYHEGASAEAIAERFPPLTPAGVHSVLGYSLRHRAELDYLAERECQADEILRSLGSAVVPWDSVRERLLVRVQDAGPQPPDWRPNA